MNNELQKEKIYEKGLFEDIKHIDEFGIEYWEARELQKVLEYKEWRKFENVIDKAKDACINSAIKVSDQFVGADKLIKHGKGGTRIIDDYHLSRYACYLIIQNSDPRKEIIALGQSYFAIQTRKKILKE